MARRSTTLGSFLLALAMVCAAALSATESATAAAPAPGAALVGHWAGTVTQKGIKPFRLTLTLSAPVKTRIGRVTLPAGKCVGTIRYTGAKAGRLVFKMTWQKGKCLAGTASLRSLGKKRLSYRWAGKYENGAPASSSAILVRKK